MGARPRPDARDDAELVRAATAGDRRAFAAIYDRYADRLYDFCWSVLRDRDEAADATQDAFLVAAERLGQLRDPERLRPWLYAAARSQALRRARARSRGAPEEEMTELPDPASGPEQAAERSLGALLAAVPPMPAPAFLRDRVLERVELVSDAGSGGDAGDAGGPGGEDSGGSGGSGVHSPRRRGAVVALVAGLLLAVGAGVGLGWERAPVSSPTNGQGGPIAAAPATSVAPTSPPTTAAPSTTTSSSTAPTTTTAAPAPPSLAVTPARVDLGAAGATANLTVRNGGGEPLSWTADPSTAWLRVSPSTGRLDGGEQARVTLSTTRDGLPEGDADGRVELTWGGPARSVVVALRVERRPEIGGLSAQFPEIFIGGCTPTTTQVDATVTDESALSSVTMRWAGGSVPMTLRGGRWSASLGPATGPGSVPWQVVATDALGNTASASGPAVTAGPCP
jgi:DNA-directed RNA polymerase specialized sigma24 family protein